MRRQILTATFLHEKFSRFEIFRMNKDRLLCSILSNCGAEKETQFLTFLHFLHDKVSLVVRRISCSTSFCLFHERKHHPGCELPWCPASCWNYSTLAGRATDTALINCITLEKSSLATTNSRNQHTGLLDLLHKERQKQENTHNLAHGGRRDKSHLPGLHAKRTHSH